jgi:Cu(I)/Ag(I) efflux system membrane protein CusA/SilA
MTYYGRKIISFIIKNRAIVLLVSACLFGWGIYMQENPIDAIPDLSENQVIVLRWMGRSPQVIEDQVTYPLVSNLQGVPKVKISGLLPCLG